MITTRNSVRRDPSPPEGNHLPGRDNHPPPNNPRIPLKGPPQCPPPNQPGTVLRGQGEHSMEIVQTSVVIAEHKQTQLRVFQHEAEEGLAHEKFLAQDRVYAAPLRFMDTFYQGPQKVPIAEH